MITADASKPANCPYCGMRHERTVCSLIKAIEYHSNGAVKRVEFKEGAPPVDWSWKPIGVAYNGTAID